MFDFDAAFDLYITVTEKKLCIFVFFVRCIRCDSGEALDVDIIAADSLTSLFLKQVYSVNIIENTNKLFDSDAVFNVDIIAIDNNRL